MNHSAIAAFAHELSQATTDPTADTDALRLRLRDHFNELGISDESASDQLFSLIMRPPDELNAIVEKQLRSMSPKTWRRAG